MTKDKKRVLFVCIGNICRSPMAEAMARKYGSDVLVAESAGLSPAYHLTSLTRGVLAEKNIDLGDHLPRRLTDLDLQKYDLVVNLSKVKLPGSIPAPVEDWPVEDPFGGDEDAYRQAREDIEMRVMRLILKARAGKL